MNIEKSQLKLHVVNDLGATIEDRLEGERKAMYELAGAAQALKQASKKVPTDLCAHVDRALTENEIDDGLSALQVAELVKKYLTRVGDFLSHLSDVEQQKAITQGGRVGGIETVIESIKKYKDSENARLEQAMMLARSAHVQTQETASPITPVPVSDNQTTLSSANATPPLRTPAEAARQVRGSLADRRAAAEAEKTAQVNKQNNKQDKDKGGIKSKR